MAPYEIPVARHARSPHRRRRPLAVTAGLVGTACVAVGAVLLTAPLRAQAAVATPTQQLASPNPALSTVDAMSLSLSVAALLAAVALLLVSRRVAYVGPTAALGRRGPGLAAEAPRVLRHGLLTDDVTRGLAVSPRS